MSEVTSKEAAQSKAEGSNGHADALLSRRRISSLPHLCNGLWELRAKRRNRNPTIDARKERHGSIEITDPDLGSTGVKIEHAFFVDLALGV